MKRPREVTMGICKPHPEDIPRRAKLKRPREVTMRTLFLFVLLTVRTFPGMAEAPERSHHEGIFVFDIVRSTQRRYPCEVTHEEVCVVGLYSVSTTCFFSDVHGRATNQKHKL